MNERRGGFLIMVALVTGETRILYELPIVMPRATSRGRVFAAAAVA